MRKLLAFFLCAVLCFLLTEVSFADEPNISNTFHQAGAVSAGQYKDVVSVQFGDRPFSACALRWDGTVAAINMGAYTEEIEQWTDIEKIVPLYYGGNAIGGIRKDGSVVITGQDNFKNCYRFDDCREWTDIVDLADIGLKLFGLKSDGTVVATGGERFGEGWDEMLHFRFSDWHDIRKISAVSNMNGDLVLLGLDAGGTLHYTGSTLFIPESWDGMQNVVNMDCSSYVYLVLKKDGTLGIGGLDSGLISDELVIWSDLIQVCAGSPAAVGLKQDGTVITAGYNETPDLDDWNSIREIYRDDYDNIYGICEDGTVRCYVPDDEMHQRYQPCSLNQSLIESWTGIEKITSIYDDDSHEMIVIGFLHDGRIVCTRDLGL